MTCPKCAAPVTGGEQCPKCGIYFQAYARHLIHLGRNHLPLGNLETDTGPAADQQRIGFQNPKINLLALPAALVAIVICKVLVFPDMLFWYFFSIPTHEMGHTLAAWFGSRFAVPIGAIIPMAGYTSAGRKPLFLIFLAMFGVLSWLGYSGFKMGSKFLQIAVILGIIILFRWSWIIDGKTWEMYMVAGGVAGEFVLSTFLISSFFHEFPDGLRWDFFRFPVLFAGSYVFTSSFMMWRRIASGAQSIPFGTFISGGGDGGGDMDRLMAVYGWSHVQITDFYTNLGWIGLAVILGHYLYFGVLSIFRPNVQRQREETYE